MRRPAIQVSSGPPTRRFLRLAGAAVLAMVLGGLGTPAPGLAATLYVGPATDPAFTVVAPRLLGALFPDQRLNAIAVADSTAALDSVVTDASSAALTDLATMLAFVAAKHLPAERLEFHGPLEQRCLLAFARRDGWVRNFSDLVTTNNAPRPSLALAGSGAAALFGILTRLEPGLSGVDVQSGDADPLAAQVARGTSDLLLLAAYAELDHTQIERLADNEQLSLLPVITRLLSRAALDRDSGFTMQPVRTASGLVPWGRDKITTLCTPVGVVLRSDATPALRDGVTRAVPTVAGLLRPSLADRAGTAASNTLNDALDAVQGLITRLRSN